MNPTSTPEQRIYEASRAREVLDNEAFQQAFADIEKELTETWKSSPQRDVEGRERLFVALTMLGKVKQTLQASLDAGKLALLTLQHDNPTLRRQAQEWLAE